jgi:surfeit locus 1 family protein
LNPAHPVTHQHHNEKQNGESDPKRQRTRHGVLARCCASLWLVFCRTTTHHVHQGCSQAADNGHEGRDDEVFHAPDYPFPGADPALARVNPYGLRFWLVTVATMVTVGVTAALGFWQLGRAAQKKALQASVDARAALPVWGSVELLTASDLQSALYRPVRLRGTWMQGVDVYLDNRQMNGRTGFFLVTPLRLAGSDQFVLVQRGWVPRDFTDRTRVPRPDTPEGEVTIEGHLAPPPGKLFEFGQTGTGPIRQNVDVAAFAAELKIPLLQASVTQSSVADDGLQRDWPRVTTNVDRHYGYAFQWFALCALAAILYLWFQFISPRRKRSTHGPVAR